MSTKTLHITNGDSLNNWLLDLKIKGDYAVWREMLCEGKTTYTIGSKTFIDDRTTFFKTDYNLGDSNYEAKFITQLELIKSCHEYDEIILWFEYDVFCHINMIACISYLLQSHCTTPIYLVCSGEISGETGLKGLSELTEKQLLEHYEQKIQLTSNDLLLCDHLWKIYCSDDHTQLQPELATGSSFLYLYACIKAHKERFPDKVSGLNALEIQILKRIKEHIPTSEHQLCRHILRNQGYYGYGDMQIFKIIKRLSSYFESLEEHLTLTEKGRKALDGEYTIYEGREKPCYFGGVSKYAYIYNKDTQQLITS
ncbi:DUF1835 domain-containing protein [Dokdonia sp.]|uniref:DUF1835 domain-containing protein n=1 Tax=Dokdonia sp. TaxID=2024995 RepID=UPI00326731FA